VIQINGTFAGMIKLKENNLSRFLQERLLAGNHYHYFDQLHRPHDQL
jgi:hypothetical protein